MAITKKMSSAEQVESALVCEKAQILTHYIRKTFGNEYFHFSKYADFNRNLQNIFGGQQIIHLHVSGGILFKCLVCKCIRFSQSVWNYLLRFVIVRLAFRPSSK